MLLAGACVGGEPAPSRIEPTGPPRIRSEVVARHAEQFDQELPDRPGGSQEEQAASQYILGHLQQAGYVSVQLEAVPVENLVESTNLVALPPGGEQAETIVAVAYDARESTRSGESIGLFLELARALYVADPDHRVEFVALAAEMTEPHLGSRRLAQQLRDEGRSPEVITLVPGIEQPSVRGALADEIVAAAREVDVGMRSSLPASAAGDVDVFAEAGFDSALVGGPAADIGTALLVYLGGDAK